MKKYQIDLIPDGDHRFRKLRWDVQARQSRQHGLVLSDMVCKNKI